MIENWKKTPEVKEERFSFRYLPLYFLPMKINVFACYTDHQDSEHECIMAVLFVTGNKKRTQGDRSQSTYLHLEYAIGLTSLFITAATLEKYLKKNC